MLPWLFCPKCQIFLSVHYSYYKNESLTTLYFYFISYFISMKTVFLLTIRRPNSEVPFFFIVDGICLHIAIMNTWLLLRDSLTV